MSEVDLLPPAVAAGVDLDGGEVPRNNKFGLTWPSEPLSHVPPPPSSDRSALSSSSSDTESSNSSDEEAYHPDYTAIEGSSERLNGLTNVTTSAPSAGRWKASSAVPGPPKYPVFSRASSMPVPSRLSHLQNPHRPSGMSSRSSSSSSTGYVEASQFHELSLELADTVQTIIQTMLQVSPSQLLDPAKESFSACALSIPTPSMSALFTQMKNLNYMSANMAKLCSMAQEQEVTEEKLLLPYNKTSDFDIGEMLQSVGDALSGISAQAGVDIVLFHGDVGMKHFCVRGDENGLSYALCHIVRQVLGTAQRGDTIEIGLFIDNLAPKRDATDEERPFDEVSPSPVDLEGPLRCTFDIAHKFYPPETSNSDDTQEVPETRPVPMCSSLLLRRLLQNIDAALEMNLPTRRFPQGRTCELQVTLEPGSPTSPTFRSGPPENCVSSEPTLEELLAFSETLRSKKVSLHASVKGSFAHHLTSYLTAWGLDVSHISAETEYAEQTVDPSYSPTSGEPMSRSEPSPRSPAGMPSTTGVPLSSVAEHPTACPPSSSFVIIDDDVKVLRQRLQELRAEQSYPLSMNSRKRPSLVSHHRPRSSPHVVRAMGQPPPPLPTTPIVIMHFTSLSNYKITKDVIQASFTSASGSTTPLPEVMIIPKPAGPRRFLTALHTAVTRPIVDPFFAPIATSPKSPGIFTGQSFFQISSNMNSPKSPNLRPSGSRTNSDRSSKSNKEFAEQLMSSTPLPPSPLGMSESLEYFTEASVKLGSSPSSGFVIQSPDGQPAGIFFHPRGKTNKDASGVQMERNRGQLYAPTERRMSVSPRLPPRRLTDRGASNVNFASLHASSGPAPKLFPSPIITNSVGLGLDIGDEKDRGSLQRSEERSPAAGAQSPRPPRSPEVMARKASSPPTSPLAEGSNMANRRMIVRRVTPESKPSGAAVAAAASAASAKLAAKKGKGPDGNVVPPISVLVVDDNPINQTILTTFLKKKKIRYDVAMNGQEAVQKWRTGGFHLILMDIQMPIMDGIQATKEIRHLERANASAGYPPTPCGEETPRLSPIGTPSETRGSPYRSSVIIVALTASSLPSDRVAALAAGCNDFLTKPVSLVWLNSKIIEWGSIKALQMWADLRPDVVKSLSSSQIAKAQELAGRLHVPKGRRTPSPARSAMILSEGGITATSSAPLVPPVTSEPVAPDTPAIVPTEAIESAVDSIPPNATNSSEDYSTAASSDVTRDSSPEKEFAESSDSALPGVPLPRHPAALSELPSESPLAT